MEVIQMSVQTSQRPKAEDAIEAAPVLMINEERERLVGTCSGPVRKDVARERTPTAACHAMALGF